MNKVLLSVIFLLGCDGVDLNFGSGTGTTTGPSFENPEVGSPCEGNVDCKEGDICYGFRQDVEGDYGSCGRSCYMDSQCGPGAHCDGSQCWKICKEASDCDNPSSVCVQVQGTPSCKSADGYVGDVCEATGSWCLMTPGGFCQDGLCTAVCAGDKDCPADSVCGDGLCRFPCVLDMDCRVHGKFSKCEFNTGWCIPL